ncbi:MAG: S4 domain-containing protein, partial [Planctomycetia bacterium]
VMSISDEVLGDWFRLLTRVPLEEVALLLKGHPRDAKARLGQEIAGFFHGATAGRQAREDFDRRFRDKELPAEIPEHSYPPGAPEGGFALPNLLKELGLCASTSDARRMIEQGGVKLDGTVVKDPKAKVAAQGQALLVQAGKLKFARVLRDL